MVFPQQCEKKRKIARCCAAASVSVFALTLRLGSGGCGLVCRWTTRPFERRLAFPPNVLLFIIFLDAASFSDIGRTGKSRKCIRESASPGSVACKLQVSVTGDDRGSPFFSNVGFVLPVSCILRDSKRAEFWKTSCDAYGFTDTFL